CLNRVCDPGYTCVVDSAGEGQCVTPDAIQDDGGPGVADSQPPSVTEAGFDPCAGCRGACTNGKCMVDCNGAAGCTGEVCGPGLDCVINCNRPDECKNMTCTTGNSCVIQCNGRDSCRGISCKASTCSVTCNGDSACHGPVSVQASNAGTIACEGAPEACD